MKITLFFILFLNLKSYSITQVQANNIVKAHIAVLQLPSNYLLYSYGIKSASSTINSIAFNMQIITPNSDSFMYFVDENSFANWGHNCKYIFVNVLTGEVVSVNYNYPPRDLDLATKLKFLENIPIGNKFNFNTNIVNRTTAIPSNECYAVIISGGASKGSNWIRYWNDCQAMYKVLTQVYGYKKSNIYCLISDGTNPAADRALYDGSYDNSPIDLDNDGVNDVAYDATKNSISTVFNVLQNKLNPNDFLFIFSTDHGSATNNDVILNLWNDEITATQFAIEVDKVNAGHIGVTMEQCYSGGFISKLCKQDRSIATACLPNELSYAKAPDYLYNDFVYHWISAVGKKTPSGLTVNADSNSDGKISLHEAFQYADIQGTAIETPQYCSQGIPIGSSINLFGDFCKTTSVFNQTYTMPKKISSCIIESQNTKIQDNKTIFLIKTEANLSNNFEVNSGAEFEISVY